MNPVEEFLTPQEEREVVDAIRRAEKQTSGEIRVHLEEGGDAPVLSRAKEVFSLLHMDRTRHRNGVLIYIAVVKKQFAILGDEGIDRQVPDDFWENEKELIQSYFSQGQFKEALVQSIERIGEKLKAFFPYEKDDANELPDELSKM